MMRLNRKQRTVRNLLVCGLLSLLLYILLGCPPLTERGMLARIQRDYLLPDLKTVYTIRSSFWNGNDVFKTRSVYIIAQTGEEYVSFGYRTHLLDRGWNTLRNVKIQKEAVCVAGEGTIYVASEKLRDAASASALVGTDPAKDAMAYGQPEGEPYSLEGVRINEQVFAFSYVGMGLAGGVNRQDTVPVTVTLYDADGGVLDTLSLEVPSYELIYVW